MSLNMEDLEYEFVNIGEFDTIEEIPIPLRTSLTGSIINSNSNPGDLVSITLLNSGSSGEAGGSNSSNQEVENEGNGQEKSIEADSSSYRNVKTMSLSSESDLAASLLSDGNRHTNTFGTASMSSSSSQDYDEIKKNLELIQKENADLKDILKNFKQNTKSAFEQAEQYKTKFAIQLTKLEETLQNLEKVKDENVELKQTTYNVASLKDEVNRLNRELETTKRERIDRLEAVRIESQFENLTSTIDSKNAEINAACMKLSEIHHLYEESKKENANLLQQIAFQQQEATKYAICASLRDEQEREINKLKADVERLSLSNEQASIAFTKLSECQGTLQTVQKENDLLRLRETTIVEEEKQRNTYHIALREAKDRDIERLKQEMEDCKRTSFEAFRIENEALRAKLAELERNSKSSPTTDCCAKKDADIRLMRQSYEKARSSVERLEEVVNGLERENNYLKQRISIYEKENGSYKARIALLLEENNSVNAYKAQMDIYKADFEAEKNSREELNKEIEKLQQEIIRVKDDLNKKNTELENLHRTHLQLATEHVERPNTSDSSPTNPTAPASSTSSTPLPTLTSGFASLFNYVKREFEELGNNKPEGATANIPTDSAPPQSDTASNNSSNVSDEEGMYSGSCPICGKQFVDIQKLQNHAAICGTGFEEFYNIERSDPFVFP